MITLTLILKNQCNNTPAKMLACEIITFGVLRIIASDIQQGNPLASDIQQGTSINARAEVDPYLV